MAKLFSEPIPLDLECAFFVLSRPLLCPKCAKGPEDNFGLTKPDISNPVIRAVVDAIISVTGSTAPKAEIASGVETVGTISLAAVTIGAAFAAPRYARRIADNAKGRVMAQKNDDSQLALSRVVKKSLYSHGSCKDGKLSAQGTTDVVSLLRLTTVFNAQSLKNQRAVGATPQITRESVGIKLYGPQYGMKEFLKRTGLELTPDEINRVVAQAGVTTEKQNVAFAESFPGYFDKNGDIIVPDHSDVHGVSFVTSVQSGPTD